MNHPDRRRNVAESSPVASDLGGGVICSTKLKPPSGADITSDRRLRPPRTSAFGQKQTLTAA